MLSIKIRFKEKIVYNNNKINLIYNNKVNLLLIKIKTKINNKFKIIKNQIFKRKLEIQELKIFLPLKIFKSEFGVEKF